MLTWIPLHLDKLRLSSRQQSVLNNDPATRNWPEIFFWTEGLILLHWVQLVVHHLPDLDADAQANFWQGNVPVRLTKLLPARLANCSPARIVEYCRACQSMQKARTRLIVKACGDRENRKGVYSEAALGDVWLDEKKFVVNEAAKFKSVNHYQLPQFIYKAAKQDDVRFFIRLGKALQSKHCPQDVDWTRCDPLACFLVQNWCEGCNYGMDMPALCFFTDQALADFCSAAFDRRPGNPSCAAIRQWRRRLGLKQVRSPKVRKVILKGDSILFA